MDVPFCKQDAIGELIQDIAEMTMVQSIPTAMGGGWTLVYYPWTPAAIEELSEQERIWYRDAKREVQRKLADSANRK